MIITLPVLQERDGEIAGNLQFIDFEYGDFSYRSFDIANHFNEYAGFECEYSRYPDREHIAHFVRQYLQEGASQPVVSQVITGNVPARLH